MDMVRNEVRQLIPEHYTETKALEHASQQARQRNYQDFLIVDVDSHHYENESHKEVFEYIESPVIRRAAMDSMSRGGVRRCSTVRWAIRTSTAASPAQACANWRRRPPTPTATSS